MKFKTILSLSLLSANYVSAVTATAPERIGQARLLRSLAQELEPNCYFCNAWAEGKITSFITDDELKPQGAGGNTCKEIQVIAATLDPRWVPSLCAEVIQKEEINCCPDQPTKETTNDPTSSPTKKPSPQPTKKPTKKPTPRPTPNPTPQPSAAPSSAPTSLPTTAAPSKSPTNDPTSSPTKKPSAAPTSDPTSSPTAVRDSQIIVTQPPTTVPTKSPSKSEPADQTCEERLWHPAQNGDLKCTNDMVYPDGWWTHMKAMFFFESAEECCAKYFGPKINNFKQEWCEKDDICPSQSDEVLPVSPTREPTNQPTSSPPKETRDNATSSPTKQTTAAPSKSPTNDPTSSPTKKPSAAPTSAPTSSPTTAAPSKSPTNDPTSSPSVKPSLSPSSSPSAKPSLRQSSNDPEIIQQVLAAPESDRINSGSKSGKANSEEQSQSYSLQEARFSAPSFAPSYTPRCTFCPARIPDGEVKPEGAKGNTCNEIQDIANDLAPQLVPILCERVIQKEERICCPNQPTSSPSQARRQRRSQRSRRR